MKLMIKNEEENVKISHEDSVIYDFDLSKTVELTEFIKFVSESKDLIECEPESFEIFSNTDSDIKDENLKLVEYVFKIVDAFNDSYSEIYKEEEDDTSNQ